jgi:hypothetical protein
MMAEAAADDVVKKLPGHGRPLDLSGYHRADPQTRAVAKLLKDHDVLPKPLQDRKEAEDLAARAESEATRAVADLAARREAVDRCAAQLLALLPPASLADLLAPAPLPTYLASADRAALPAPAADVAELCRQLCEAVTAYNRRRRSHRHRIEELLSEAAAFARRLNEQAMLSHRLPAANPLPEAKAEMGLAAFDQAAPALGALPDDLPRRAASAAQGNRPRWRRWLFR